MSNSPSERWTLKLEAHYGLVVIAIAAAIFLTTSVSPPSLMDDVDAAQAAIARAMLRTGDWITPRLHGFVYLDKSPLVYWAMAASLAEATNIKLNKSFRLTFSPLNK